MHILTKCPHCSHKPIYPYLGKALDRNVNKIENVERFDLTRFCPGCGKLLNLGFNPTEKYFCWVHDSKK